MMRTQNWTLVAAAAAVLALGAVGEALARGPMRGPRGDMGGGGPPMGAVGGYDRHLLDQLTYPCQTDCMQAYRDCDETADAAFLTCVGTPCATQITAAQDACKTDKRAQACWDATTALNTCVLSQTTCISTQAGAIATCSSDLQKCTTACTSTN